jgi:uncharacterized protein (DUF427 family)
MARVMWNGSVIAESDRYEIVEGNVYFPPGSLNREYLRDSDTHSMCPWKGQASYYNLVMGEEVNRDAAWYYPDPEPAAEKIKDHVAFDKSKGVQIER